MKKILMLVLFACCAACFGQEISKSYKNIVKVNKDYSVACDFNYSKDLADDKITGYILIGFYSQRDTSSRSSKLSRAELQEAVVQCEKVWALMNNEGFMSARCNVNAGTDNIQLKLVFISGVTPSFEISSGTNWVDICPIGQVPDFIEALKKIITLYDEHFNEFSKIPVK